MSNEIETGVFFHQPKHWVDMTHVGQAITDEAVARRANESKLREMLHAKIKEFEGRKITVELQQEMFAALTAIGSEFSAVLGCQPYR